MKHGFGALCANCSHARHNHRGTVSEGFQCYACDCVVPDGGPWLEYTKAMWMRLAAETRAVLDEPVTTGRTSDEP